MSKLDELVMRAGTTGNHQVWFTRPEAIKLVELVIQECVKICQEATHNDCFSGHEFEYAADKIREKFSAQ